METINKASQFNNEIAKTAKSLRDLTLANAPFAELEACNVKLSSLIDEKRKFLFSAPDPAYYIDEFLRCAPIGARRIKARELAELALCAINDIFESTEQYDPLDLETYSAMHEFFDHFSRSDKTRIDGEQESDTTVLQLSENSRRLIRTFEDLSDQFKYYLSGALTGLVKREFLTPQNARLLKYRLERLPKMVEGKPVIWERNAKSLASAIIIADRLSEVDFDKRRKPRTGDIDTKVPSEIGANYYSFLLSGFDVKVGGKSEATYYRALVDVEDDMDIFISNVNGIRSERKHGLPVTNSYADIISYFFLNLSNFPEEQDRIKRLCNKLDFKVLEAYADEISRKRNQVIS